jgi:hypothetical protein
MNPEQAPLLPQNIHVVYRFGPPPICFPSSGYNKPYKYSHRLPSDLETARDSPPPWTASLPPTYKSGLPKVTRDCLISEFICYGKYIAAVLLVFGAGGVLLALWASGRL